MGGVGLAALALIATAGLASAKFTLMDEESRDQLEEAVENKDYESWKSIIESAPRITDYIDSQEDFERYIEMKELMKDGNTEEAEAIREELGLPEGLVRTRSQKGGNSAAREAVENGDYQAWLEATDEDSKMREYITDEAAFNKLVELYQAKENDDDDRVEELREELGLPERPMGCR